MGTEVKRNTELAIIGCLSTNPTLTGKTFLPTRGGGDTAKEAGPVPPFGIVNIEEAEKTHPLSRTWQLKGSVIWVTKLEATTAPDHASTVKLIEEALLAITGGYDTLRSMRVHGLEIENVSDFDDQERRSHGDVLTFSMGVSEGIVNGS